MDTFPAKSAIGVPSVLRRLVSGAHVWSLGDQALISATSFLSLYFMVHWTNASEVGLYSFALSVLAMFLVIQDSLIVRPYTVQLFSQTATPQEHSLSALLITLAMACAAAAFLAFGAVWLWLSGPASSALTSLCLVLAAALPAVALREFVRRHAFANLYMSRAFFTDAAGVTIGLCFLVLLGLSEKLHATSAIAALALAFAVPSIFCVFISRTEYAYSPKALLATLSGSWKIGKWFLPNRAAMEGQGYVVQWISFALAGPALAGIYSAHLAIVALANPLLLGLLNIMTPRAVRALKVGGRGGLKVQALGELLVVLAVLTMLVAVIAVAGKQIMAFVFPSEEYADQENLLLLLALVSSAGWIGAPAAVALQSSGRERIVAYLSIASLFGCLAMVWIALPAWGLPGAAIALLAAETVISLTKWAVLLAFSPEVKANARGNKAEK